jgi:hypothetical protein
VSAEGLPQAVNERLDYGHPLEFGYSSSPTPATRLASSAVLAQEDNR